LLEAKLSWGFLPRNCLVSLPRFLLLLEVLQEIMQLLLWCDIFLLLLLVFLYLNINTECFLLFRGQSLDGWLLLPQVWQ
jgi:hypothetical protein